MKYKICQTKNCKGLKTNIYVSSSKDINTAHKRAANTMNRIDKYGRHTTSSLCGCSNTTYSDRYGLYVNYDKVKCKAKFEVRETQ